MSSSIDKYYERLEDYEKFCNEINVKPKNDFYEHQQKLLEEWGFESLHEFYSARNKSMKRISVIKDIL